MHWYMYVKTLRNMYTPTCRSSTQAIRVCVGMLRRQHISGCEGVTTGNKFESLPMKEVYVTMTHGATWWFRANISSSCHALTERTEVQTLGAY